MTDTTLETHFGTCPECHETDGYISVGRGHWFYCSTHRTRWFVGENLFDSWKHETEEEQRARYDELGFDTFRDVAAFHPATENTAHARDLIDMAEFETDPLRPAERRAVLAYVEAIEGIEDTVAMVNGEALAFDVVGDTPDAQARETRRLIGEAFDCFRTWWDALDALHAEVGFGGNEAPTRVITQETTRYFTALTAARREAVRYFMGGDAGPNPVHAGHATYSNGFVPIGAEAIG